MPLRPHVVQALAETPPSHQQQPEDILASRLTEHELVTPEELRPKIEHVEDRRIPGPGGEIPIRIYTPKGEGPFPLFIYFHGGGFVLLNIDTHDVICRKLANRTGSVVISVGYRLAPEHPFPAAPEDCYAATRWAYNHAVELNGNGKLYVGGDSAGGNLATVVCLMARDRRETFISKQVLLYPVIDYHQHNEPSVYPSYEDNAVGFGLSNIKMSHFWSFYLPEQRDRKHPYASPIQADDLSQLPEALVITIEKDVLRDEGEVYAARLREAGVSVIAKRLSGTIHGYLRTFPDQEESEETFELISSFLHSS